MSSTNIATGTASEPISRRLVSGGPIEAKGIREATTLALPFEVVRGLLSRFSLRVNLRRRLPAFTETDDQQRPPTQG